MHRATDARTDLCDTTKGKAMLSLPQRVFQSICRDKTSVLSLPRFSLNKLAGLLLMTGVFSVATPPPVGGANTFWLPITDADRAMNAPVVEKDAGVEALFWRVAVLDYTRGQEGGGDREKKVRSKASIRGA